MSINEFQPETALGEKLAQMDREELLSFVGRLCTAIQAEVGARSYRGGIFPENISLNAQGAIGIGPGKLEKWKGQELDYIAPELYWDAKTSAASDVYSLGLLLWYGVSGGKLPFEGESPNAQLSRMSGKAIPAPPHAGQRLGEIIQRACSFKPEERYLCPAQLQIMLDSCLENQYLSGNTGSQAVFGKSGEQLSEMERLMVDIIEGREEVPKEENGPRAGDWERDAFVDDLMKPDEPPAAPKPEEEPAEPPPQMIPIREKPAAPPEDEADDVRVYEPAKERRVPVLHAVENSELAPVVPSRDPRPQNLAPRLAIQQEAAQTQAAVQEKKEKRRRGRPLLVVASLCALLLIGALVADALLLGGSRAAPEPTPTPEPTPEQTVYVQPVEVEPTPEPTTVSRYEAFRADLSWTEAQAACRAMGGHLAVITSQEEFNEVVICGAAAGISRIWIGCHREDGVLVYETDEAVSYARWDEEAGEPSLQDAYDGAAEDYLMIWYRDGGWYYNDSRNDPVAVYPNWYSGTVGYVCEFEETVYPQSGETTVIEP